MHQELIMGGHSQNAPCGKSNAMEEGSVQQLDRVLIDISNSPKQEKEIVNMQETMSRSG